MENNGNGGMMAFVIVTILTMIVLGCVAIVLSGIQGCGSAVVPSNTMSAVGYMDNVKLNSENKVGDIVHFIDYEEHRACYWDDSEYMWYNTDYYWRDFCVPYTTGVMLNDLYDGIGENEYNAHSHGTGNVEVIDGMFDDKIFHGMKYEYQYGMYLSIREFMFSGERYIKPIMIVSFAEPLDTMMLRLHLYFCGISHPSTWVNFDEGKTFILFNTDNNYRHDCGITKEYIMYHNECRLETPNVGNIELLYGELILDNDMSGKVKLQFKYEGIYFTQEWYVEFE